MARYEKLTIWYRHLCAGCRVLLCPGQTVIYDWQTHKCYCRHCGQPALFAF
jgi:RNase P subunit RPR2